MVELIGKMNTLWRYAKVGWERGADWRSKCLLATMLPRFKLARALGINSERIYCATLRWRGYFLPFYFRAQDIFIMYEILAGNPYIPAWLDQSPPNHIVDLGAHIGLATLSFKAHFPGAFIHCYEPDPDNFQLLKLNTAGLPGVFLHPEAVGARSGEAVLYVNHQRHSASSLKPERKGEAMTEVRCVVKALDEILAMIGSVDIIKFDIEGLEYEVFASSRLAQSVKCIVGEMKAEFADLERFLALFPGHDARWVSVAQKMYLIYLWRRNHG